MTKLLLARDRRRSPKNTRTVRTREKKRPDRRLAGHEGIMAGITQHCTTRHDMVHPSLLIQICMRSLVLRSGRSPGLGCMIWDGVALDRWNLEQLHESRPQGHWEFEVVPLAKSPQGPAVPEQVGLEEGKRLFNILILASQKIFCLGQELRHRSRIRKI